MLRRLEASKRTSWGIVYLVVLLEYYRLRNTRLPVSPPALEKTGSYCFVKLVGRANILTILIDSVSPVRSKGRLPTFSSSVQSDSTNAVNGTNVHVSSSHQEYSKNYCHTYTNVSVKVVVLEELKLHCRHMYILTHRYVWMRMYRTF